MSRIDAIIQAYDNQGQYVDFKGEKITSWKIYSANGFLKKSEIQKLPIQTIEMVYDSSLHRGVNNENQI
jgi:hypothetical protein